MPLLVKVRIFCVPSFLLWMLLFYVVAYRGVSALPIQRSSKSVHGALEDYDEICRNKSKDLVYDEVQRMCVPCGSCLCDSPDPHCQKCRALRILICETTTQMTTLEEMTLPLQTTQSPIETTSKTLTTTVTTELSYTTEEVAAAASGSAVKILIGAGVLVVILIALGLVAAILLCMKYKRCCQKKQLPHGQQETQPHETYPMVGLGEDSTTVHQPEADE